MKKINEYPVGKVFHQGKQETSESFARIEEYAGFRLPLEYKNFLLQNGGPTLDEVSFYEEESIYYFNKMYKCEESIAMYEIFPQHKKDALRNILQIGDDSGGRGIFLKKDCCKIYIQHVSAVTDLGLQTVLANSLEEWLEAGCELPE